MFKYITVKPHLGNAGIGHKFANFIVPLVLTKKYNLKYIYQPIVEKDESNIHAMAPSLKWNNFLNFGDGELTLKDLPKNIHINNIPYIPQEEIAFNHWIFKMELNKPYNGDILYKISQEKDGQFLCIDWDFYKNNNLKKKYNNSQSVRNFKNYFSKDCTNCAIHVRREDVTKNMQYNRWKDLDYYLSIIENFDNIEVEFPKPFMYHIYSSLMPKEDIKKIIAFKNIKNLNIKLHIDEDLFSTFYHMTKANIFVSGQGSFSLMANYLTNAIKLTTSWHMFWRDFPKDIKDIIEINKNGSFDKNKLIEAMV